MLKNKFFFLAVSCLSLCLYGILLISKAEANFQIHYCCLDKNDTCMDGANETSLCEEYGWKAYDLSHPKCSACSSECWY